MSIDDFMIFTDTSCDLGLEKMNDNNIGFISYLVNVGGDPDEYYQDLVELSTEDFYNKIRSGEVMPRTSMPSISAYTDKFEKALSEGKDILCITLTKKFSGSFTAATNAKKILEEKYPNRRIVIIDSKSATGVQGAIVLEAVRMKNNGLSIDEIAEKLEIIAQEQFVYLTVDSLKYLQKGGRIGKVSALAGTILNIKPLIVLKEGELMPFSKIRGRKKVISEMINLINNDIFDKKEQYHIVIIQSDSKKEAEQVKQTLITEHNYQLEYDPFLIGITIGAHIGPTVVGVGYIKKYEYV